MYSWVYNKLHKMRVMIINQWIDYYLKNGIAICSVKRLSSTSYIGLLRVEAASTANSSGRIGLPKIGFNCKI